MTDDRNTAADDRAAAKDPDDWTTGDAPLTGAQKSYEGRRLEEDRRAAGEVGSRPLGPALA